SPADKQQAAAALELARELLHSLEQFVVPKSDLDTTRFLHRVRGPAAALTPQADSATLALFREWARSALAAFGDLQKRCLSEREDEMWRLLGIYSRAVNTERASETRLLTELKETHARIRSLSRTEDLRAARVKLEEEL